MSYTQSGPTAPKVGIIMGSKSDLPIMTKTAELLNQLEISYEIRVISSHRTPKLTANYACSARDKGLEVLIAGAGAAAALPGILAAYTTLPVIGVPINATALSGLDSLLTIAQMPPGVPVSCMAVGEPGAKNSALFAARILSLSDKSLEQRLVTYMEKQTQKVESESVIEL